MNHDDGSGPSGSSPIALGLARGAALGEIVTAVLGPLALLILRLPAAMVFWYSARTKVEGWNIFDITDSQPFLFDYEYGLPFPVFTAHVTAIAEHVLPVMVILGVLTRLGALGLLLMTAVIQAFIYTSFDVWWSTHMWWAATLFAVVAMGPGRYSIDHLLFKRQD